MPRDGSDEGGAAEEARARAIRGVVFLNRLFEYECRDLGVSLAQYRMLLYLRHGPRRAGELAEQASITRPALSALVGGMEAGGLVRRATVDVDRRGVRLELTRQGLAAIRRVETRFGTVFEAVTEDCDRAALVAALTDLTRALTHQVETRVRAAPFDGEGT